MVLPRLIGVIHLPPLPGSPEASSMPPAQALHRAGSLAVKEAKLLSQNGFDGIIIENFGDAPFYKTQVGPETIASMAIIAAAIRESTHLKLGINVLRNDASSALAIAAVTGADFIRVNVLSGVTATDQGLIEGCAAGLIRERLRLNAQVGIIADVHVKHAQSLSSKNISLAIEETAARGGADGIIITGSTTGRAPQWVDLEEAMKAAKQMGVPLFIGSGATVESIPDLVKNSVHIIVGSALRKGGKAGAPLEAKRLRAISTTFKKASKAKKTKQK